MAIGWNLVCKNLRATEQLKAKIRQKIEKLERHLKGLPRDTVYLHVAIENHPRKSTVKTSLVLRLPHHVLKSEKRATDAASSVDAAVKALMRELESAKAHIRREISRRSARKHESELAHAFSAQPAADGLGPQNPTDVVGELLETHYDKLLKYVFRQLEYVETHETLPHGTLDTHAIVDEVARRALAGTDVRPAEMTYLVWLYALARDEFDKRCAEVAAHHTREFPLEKINVETWQHKLEQPIDTLQPQLEPDVPASESAASDESALSPDEILEQKELIANLRALAAAWPEVERDVFELHFLEGLAPSQVALIQNLKNDHVDQVVKTVRGRLSDMLKDRPADLAAIRVLAEAHA